MTRQRFFSIFNRHGSHFTSGTAFRALQPYTPAGGARQSFGQQICVLRQIAKENIGRRFFVFIKLTDKGTDNLIGWRIYKMG